MKKFKIPFYGIWIGVRNAVYGSIVMGLASVPMVFILIAIQDGLSLTSEDLYLPWMLAGMFFAALYCIAFSILPGAIGGAYLAYWLERATREPADIARRGLFVGAIAGFIASGLFFAVLVADGVDYFVIGFELIALTIAAWMGRAGAMNIANSLESHQHRNLEELGHAEYVEARKESEELK